MRHRIFQRNGKWYIDYVDPFGKRVRQLVSNYKEAAERQLMRIQVAMSEGRYEQLFDKSEPMKFRTFAERYLENHIKVVNKSSKEQESKLNNLLSYFKEFYLHEITRKKVVEYRAVLLKKGNSNSTVNKKLALLRSVYNRAIEWGDYKGVNPAKGIKRLPETNERCRWISHDEIQKLLKAMDDVPSSLYDKGRISKEELRKYEFHYKMMKCLVLLALHTGLRFGELVTLRRTRDTESNYIDLKNKVLVLHSSKTKSGKSRHIHLNRNALKVIDQIPGCKRQPFYFHNPKTRKPIGSVRKSFKRALEQAGIKDFRFHDLRHTFSSHLAMKGVDMYVLKDLLGHSTVKLTERYSHLSPRKQKEALDILGDGLYGVESFQGPERALEQFEEKDDFEGFVINPLIKKGYSN